MKTIKDKIISNVTPLIPFAFATKKLNKYWVGENGKFIKTAIGKTIVNSFVTGITCSVIILYGSLAIEHGDINYKKWPQIQEERTTQQKLDYQNSLRQEFQNLDSDFDGVIDSTEFIYRK